MRHAKIKNGLTTEGTELTEGGVNCWGSAFPQPRDEPFFAALRTPNAEPKTEIGIKPGLLNPEIRRQA